MAINGRKMAIFESVYFESEYTHLAWADFQIKVKQNRALYSAFWSVEQTDFKNVIVENIHWALFEDAKFAKVKRPRNSKRQKFYYEKW